MITRFVKLRLFKLMMLGCFSQSLIAAVPASYYDAVDSSSPLAMRQSLHDIIDDHTKIPYSSSMTDTWDVLELADQDPNNSANILAIYQNASHAKQGGGNNFYNREHSWPKSYGFPNDGDSNYPYTDMHHLFLSTISYNSERGNKPFDYCDTGCSEFVTSVNNGTGGQGGDWSNWSDDNSFEAWLGSRGNVARAMMYMAVRYEGGTHGVSGYSEPDLILTDDRSLISGSSTGSNSSQAYMGLKSVLIQWHKDDPVDDLERNHNDRVFDYQGNRNPFVDHPEWVACVFENICSGGTGDTTPPLAPTGLSGIGGNQLADLSWNANTESDLAGYHVYRSNTSAGTYSRVSSNLITTTSYTDVNLADNTTYYYVVVAVDTSNNQSANSGEVSVTTEQGQVTPPATTDAWINELHYDNGGTDIGEFVEIAGTAGLDLAGWSMVAYNGSNGTAYQTVALSGVISDLENGFGVLAFDFAGLQNGAPDGIALVNAANEVVQFLSYEGVFTAADGVAVGMTSENIGVSESSSTTADQSLQLSGAGSSYAEFSWAAAALNTRDGINNGQSFIATTPINQPPVAAFSFDCSDLTCNFDSSASSDPDGSIQSYVWDLGDSNSSTMANPSHTYSAAGSYTVSLTVSDDQGASSQTTATVSVTAPPVNQPPVANFSFVVNDLIVDFSDNSSDAEGAIASWSWDFGDGNGSNTNNPSHQYAQSGDYTVTLTVTDAEGATASQSQVVSVADSGIVVLINGVAVNGLSGSAGDVLFFEFEVPMDANSVSFEMSGGTGDADLYVKHGSIPTSTDYDCRPYQSGNNETCQFTAPGTYFIMLKGYSSFSEVSLVASYTVVSGVGFVETISDISVARRAWQHYQFEIAPGTSELTISISGGTGDTDLYVRYGESPTTSRYDCRPYKNGNEESCHFTSPLAGTWYVGLRGYSNSSGISLRVEAK